MNLEISSGGTHGADVDQVRAPEISRHGFSHPVRQEGWSFGMALGPNRTRHCHGRASDDVASHDVDMVCGRLRPGER